MSEQKESGKSVEETIKPVARSAWLRINNLNAEREFVVELEVNGEPFREFFRGTTFYIGDVTHGQEHNLTWLIHAGRAQAAQEYEVILGKLEFALQHTIDFCLCDRNTKGFDYGETHKVMGKAETGARWLTPDDKAREALKQLAAFREGRK